MRALRWLLPVLMLVACTEKPPPPAPPKPQPEWKDSVLYFVFVDRFANGNPHNDAPAGAPVTPATDFQGGDWAGVRQKLEQGYFEELGVNTIWLSVPMDNTSSIHEDSWDNTWYTAYHAYWPERLDQPEEHFGTMEELKALVDAAHARGMNVLIDYPLNHVHIDSPLYQEHPDWFWPLEQTYGTETKQCLCGQACSWEEPTESKRCWFTGYLPDFNFKVKPARDYIIDNVISWVKQTGVDGLRLDALKHVEDEVILEMRARLKQDIDPGRKQPFLLIGETFSGDPELLRYYVNPQMLDGQFDFPLRAHVIASVLRRSRSYEGTVYPTSMKDLDVFLNKNDNYYGDGLMSTFLGNHDVPRPIHHAEDMPQWGFEWDLGWQNAWENRPTLPQGTSAFERLANGFTVLFTLPGIPLIYYGDEIGMAGAGDPDNRRMMDFDSSHYTEGQMLLRDRLSKLTKIRASHAALRRGQRVSLSVTDDTLAYEMKHETGSVYVVINRADSAQRVSGVPAGTYVDQLSGKTLTEAQLELPPRSSMILVPAS